MMADPSLKARHAIRHRGGSAAPRVSVIIPVYNQEALTRQCLAAVWQTVAPGVEIVVVNDASTDGTRRMLGEGGRRLRVLHHDVNRGFAASCNDGAAMAGGELLVFLNNDTIPQPGWLEALERHAAAHPQAAAVGARLLYPDGTVQHAGVVICQDGFPRHLYAGFPAEHPAVNRSRRFQVVTAACMLVRRGAFEAAAGFDTAYRNGFEDVDLCLRLGGAGHEVHYCSASVVLHFESVSPGRFRCDRENVALYRERWLARVQPDDLSYYIADGLLRVEYEGRYPVTLEVSPRLATFVDGVRVRETERLLREQGRRVAELMRENTRLRLELGARGQDSPELRYARIREEIRATVRAVVPAGASLAVISKGDGALLDLPGCRAGHFPQTDGGAYAGHHPADSAEAIRHLELLRSRGADHLLIPETSRWWLDHYAEFREHLDRHYRRVDRDAGSCVVYDLGGPPGPGAGSAARPVSRRLPRAGGMLREAQPVPVP